MAVIIKTSLWNYPPGKPLPSSQFENCYRYFYVLGTYFRFNPKAGLNLFYSSRFKPGLNRWFNPETDFTANPGSRAHVLSGGVGHDDVVLLLIVYFAAGQAMICERLQQITVTCRWGMLGDLRETLRFWSAQLS